MSVTSPGQSLRTQSPSIGSPVILPGSTLAVGAGSTYEIDVSDIGGLLVFMRASATAGGSVILQGIIDVADPLGWDHIPYVLNGTMYRGSGPTFTANTNYYLKADVNGYTRVRLLVSSALGAALTSLDYTLFIEPNVGINYASPSTTQNVGGTVNANANMRPVSFGAALTATSLAAGATFTGTTVDRGTDLTATDTRVKPLVRHLAGNTPGILRLEQSNDGSSWSEIKRVPIPSDGLWHTFDWPVHYRYWRLLFTNGATAQTGFGLGVQSSRGDGSSVDTKNVLSFMETPAAGVAVAANGDLVGNTLDLGANHDWTKVRAACVSDAVGGNLRLEHSPDNVNWFLDQNVSYDTASLMKSAEANIVMRYVRSRYRPNANAATGVRLVTTLVSL